MRILIADDEKEFVKALSVLLRNANYSVDFALDGEEAMDCLHGASYDAVILDINMPKMNGYDVLKQMRKEGIKTPVIFLTARSQIDDKIEGFNLGADDYLPKPFSTDELVVRLRAIIIRSQGGVGNLLKFGDLTLDLAKYKLYYGESFLSLSNKEFQIMELLLSSPETVHSSQQILESAWDFDSETDFSSVWVYISSLRKKLVQLGSKVVIKSNRGAGYSLDMPNDL